MNNHKTEVAGFFSIINGFNIIHEFETLGFAMYEYDRKMCQTTHV